MSKRDILLKVGAYYHSKRSGLPYASSQKEAFRFTQEEAEEVLRWDPGARKVRFKEAEEKFIRWQGDRQEFKTIREIEESCAKAVKEAEERYEKRYQEEYAKAQLWASRFRSLKRAIDQVSEVEAQASSIEARAQNQEAQPEEVDTQAQAQAQAQAAQAAPAAYDAGRSPIGIPARLQSCSLVGLICPSCGSRCAERWWGTSATVGAYRITCFCGALSCSTPYREHPSHRMGDAQSSAAGSSDPP